MFEVPSLTQHQLTQQSFNTTDIHCIQCHHTLPSTRQCQKRNRRPPGQFLFPGMDVSWRQCVTSPLPHPCFLMNRFGWVERQSAGKQTNRGSNPFWFNRLLLFYTYLSSDSVLGNHWFSKAANAAAVLNTESFWLWQWCIKSSQKSRF